MIQCLAALLLSASEAWPGAGTAEAVAVAAWPSAWGSSSSTAYEAPAGISRIEGVDLSASYANGPGDLAMLSAGTRTGPVFSALGLGCAWSHSDGGVPAGSDHDGGTDASDPVSLTAACAWVVTGDPVGFIEGFFGPSISVGAACRAVWGEGGGGDGDADVDGDEILGSAGLQFAIFPTFSLGASVVDIPLSAQPGTEAETHWGATYIFTRELRVHASVSGDGPAMGAELDVTPWLRAGTGSDGDAWNAGVSVDIGRLTAGYGLSLDDSSAVHAVTVEIGFGGANWY